MILNSGGSSGGSFHIVTGHIDNSGYGKCPQVPFTTKPDIILLNHDNWILCMYIKAINNCTAYAVDSQQGSATWTDMLDVTDTYFQVALSWNGAVKEWYMMIYFN